MSEGESHKKRWFVLILLFFIFILFLGFLVAPSIHLPCPTVSDNLPGQLCH